MKIENPAYNYDTHGQNYSGTRKTDPRIAAWVWRALGDAKIVLNVGAGAGSYEPDDRYVIAVEPSVTMRTQRLANKKNPAINAKADQLPFDDNVFDATMAMLTLHHWPDMNKGLRELRRVTKQQIVILTFDPDELDNFWNASYFSELIAIEKERYPSVQSILESLGGETEVIPIAIPLDCFDGFQEAYYGRPDAFLMKEVRAAQSAWGFLPPGIEDKLVKRLADELESGEWDRKFGHFRTQPFFTCALRLIIATP